MSNDDWLEEAARYFEKRPTGGEDMAFWANVTNAERCRSIASALRASSGVEVKLAWEHLGGDNWRAPAPFFGSFRVEHYSGDYQALWSAPGITDTFIEGGWPSAEQAKRTIEDKVREILSCLSSPLTTVEVTEVVRDWTSTAEREAVKAGEKAAYEYTGGKIGVFLSGLTAYRIALTAALSQNKGEE